MCDRQLKSESFELPFDLFIRPRIFTYNTADSYVFINFPPSFNPNTKIQSQYTPKIVLKIYYRCVFTVTGAVKFALNGIITIFLYLENVFDSCFKAKLGGESK